MEYIVAYYLATASVTPGLETEAYDELEETVTEGIDNGYEPFGNLTVVVHDDCMRLVQPMIHKSQH